MIRMTRWMKLLALVALAGAIAVAPATARKPKRAKRPAAPAVADYLVTISNLTKGQVLSPPILTTGARDNTIWKVGSPSSFALKEIAENGNNRPMQLVLNQRRIDGSIFDLQTSPSPLVPADKPGARPDAPAPCTGGCPDKWTIRIRGDASNTRLSWVAMLVCTNDGFTGVDGMALPKKVRQSVTRSTFAYDTGTEKDTENLADMMPPCQSLIGIRSPSGAPGTTMSNPALAEGGVITAHSGIHGGRDLQPSVHGWTGPVAQISVKRVR